MRWPNRVAARLKRVGVWRLLVVLAALAFVWMALRDPGGPPSLGYVRRF